MDTEIEQFLEDRTERYFDTACRAAGLLFLDIIQLYDNPYELSDRTISAFLSILVGTAVYEKYGENGVKVAANYINRVKESPEESVDDFLNSLFS